MDTPTMVLLQDKYKFIKGTIHDHNHNPFYLFFFFFKKNKTVDTGLLIYKFDQKTSPRQCISRSR